MLKRTRKYSLKHATRTNLSSGVFVYCNSKTPYNLYSNTVCTRST